MGKIVHILTVGTSLLTNKGGKISSKNSDYLQNLIKLNTLCDKILEQAPQRNVKSPLQDYKCDLLDRLRNIDLDREVGFRPPKPGGPEPPRWT